MGSKPQLASMLLRNRGGKRIKTSNISSAKSNSSKVMKFLMVMTDQELPILLAFLLLHVLLLVKILPSR